jgi:superfamily II DNA or RNA helicase
LRLFDKRQKQFLYLKAKGKCSECGEPLKENWHGDHILPYSKGGDTTIFNGQALCENCNLKKGSKITSSPKLEIIMSKTIQQLVHPEIKEGLRPWQQDFYTQPYNRYLNYHFNEPISDWKAFLSHAGVGAGKTLAGKEAATLFLKDGFQVIVLSPSTDIKREWAMEFKKNNDCNILEKYKFQTNWMHMTYKDGKPYKGISLTYHSLNKNNLNFLINIIKQSKMNVLLICDEVHHLGDTKSWGDAVIELSKHVCFTLSFTGTPFRSDNNPIPNVKYVPKSIGASLFHSNEWELVCDYSYSYAASIKDKICCPIQFHKLSMIEINGVMHNKPLKATEADKYNSLIQIKENILNPAVKKILDLADTKTNLIRSYASDAAILVVCERIESAINLYKQLPPEDATLVVSNSIDNEDAAKKIIEFKTSKKKWLISVNMISEGVNIPRIRTIVYLSAKTTPLFFTQVTGRGVRNFNKNLVDSKGFPIYDLCYFLMFDYEPLNVIADNITADIKHMIGEDIFSNMIENSSREYVQLPPSIYTDFNAHDVKYTEDGITTNEDGITENEVEQAAKVFGVPLDQARHILIESLKITGNDSNKTNKKPITYASSVVATMNLNNLTYPEQAEKVKSLLRTRIARLAFLRNPLVSKYDGRIGIAIATIRNQINKETGCMDGVSDVHDVDILKTQLELVNRYIREIEVLNDSLDVNR